MQPAKRSAICLLPILLFFVAAIYCQSAGKVTPQEARETLTMLSRMGAKKPFLKDSSDVYLEKQSLNRFFTMPIYQKLEGNSYFGYRYDEGFILSEKQIQIAVFNDITEGQRCKAAYRRAIENALKSAGIAIKPNAPCQIGICIVGVEERETDQTLPGIMIEAYLRNASIKKSFFYRYGAGSQRGLAAALRLSAEMLIAELAARAPEQKSQSFANKPKVAVK